MHSPPLHLKQGRDWIEVFRSMLHNGEVVSIDTWVWFKRRTAESYNVREVIKTVFGKTFPEDAVQLITMVDEAAARAQTSFH